MSSTDTAASATPMKGHPKTRKNRIQNALASLSPPTPLFRPPPLIRRITYCTIGTIMDAAVPTAIPSLADAAVAPGATASDCD